MRPSGTEPGDFVEFDYDLIEAERRQRIRDVLLKVRSDLEKEIGSELQISNDGNELVLMADGQIRFRSGLASDGRLVVTDIKKTDRL